ncbi:MAG: hypothetical protein AVDCRST_MAG57-1330 [uncultured Blastococcus sp.]|uniref:Uncharacterized protein n=1 Tax=uncultured Blastococcus sp. TaxID=217144 RepID=A0A6J4HYH8_9ACTN|nr:MAG: hypothetical protein AVDCRST_MAG57-1330 [uncultured Blastococcus sp.]
MYDRLRLTANRIRSKVLCRSNRHMWALRRNPEVGGPEAHYETCRRCGKERTAYVPSKSRDWGWFGA